MAGNISTKFNRLGWPNPPAILSYGVAVLSVVAAVSILSLMEANFGTAAHVSLFLGAVMFSTWFGGVGPGLLAIALSIMAFDYFFLLPLYSLAVEVRQLPRLLLYVLLAFFVWSVSWAARRATESLRHAHNELQRSNEALRAENSERKQVEEQLRQAEEQARKALDAIPQQIWSGPPDGTLDYCNYQWRAFAGLGLEDIQGDGWQRMLHPEDKEQVLIAWSESAATGTPYEQEERHRRADGVYRWFLCRGVPLRDAEGRIERWYGSNTDITERKCAEEALRRSEDHLRLVINTIPIMAWSVQPDGTIDFINQPWLDYAGLSLEEFMKQPMGAVHPEDLPAVLEKWRTDMAIGEFFEHEMRLRRADGEYRWFFVRTAPLHDEQGTIVKWYGVAIDIEERKQAVDALRRSEDHLRLVTDTIPALVFSLLPDGSLDYINQRHREFTGLSLNDVRGWQWTNLIHPEDHPLILGKWHTALATGEPVEAEARLQRATEDYRWLLIRCVPLRDGTGKIVKWYGTKTDIEDRKQMEERLRQVERELRLVIDTIPANVWRALPDGPVDFTNQRLLKDLGYSYQDLVGWSWTNVLHPEDVTDFVNKWHVALASGEPMESEARVRRADGEYRWYLIRNVPLKDDAGNVIRWYGTGVDITDRKRAREALQESEAKLKAAQRIAKIGYWERDLITDHIIWSEETCRIFGLQPGQVLSQTKLQEMIHPDDRQLQRLAFQEALQGKHRYDVEYHIVRPDGEVRFIHVWDEIAYDERGRPIRMFGTVQDITERKQAEEALRESQQLLQLVLATLPVGVMVTDQAGDILLVNAASKRIWDDIITSGNQRWAQSKGFWHYSGERIAPTTWASARALSEGQTSLNELIDIETFDGKQKTMENSAAPIRNADGLIVGAVIVNEDVTERVQAEEALRRSEENFRKAFNASPAPSTIVRARDRQLLNVNGAFVRTFGYTAEEVIGRTFAELRLQPVAHRREEFWRKLQGKKAIKGYEARLRTKSGELIDVLVYAEAIELSGEQCFLSSIIDISERKRAEEMLQTFPQRLIEAQEAERRRVARELHDEIGQALTAIKINLQAVQHSARTSPLASQLHESIGIVDRALEQVRDLSFNLRPSLLDDLGLIAALRWYVDREARRAGLIPQFVVEISETHLPPELATACFRIVQEALTNVVRHAQASHVWVELRQRAAELHLVVRDDGIGFDVSAARGHYASDESLGLQGMQERALILGGKIEIESAPTQGTEVHASFPLVAATPTTAKNEME